MRSATLLLLVTFMTVVLLSTTLDPAGVAPARAAPEQFFDEAAYLDALAAAGLHLVSEGFEDDTVWGDVRTTVAGGAHTAPEVTSQGITWRANGHPASEITTGHGPARSGLWGVFGLPHTVGDGFGGTGATTLYSAGGWIETNTPPAELHIILDGVTDLGFGEVPLGPAHQFYGVIDLDGFQSFAFVEVEGTPGELKFIFGDDMSIGVGTPTGIADPMASAATLHLSIASANPFRESVSLELLLDIGAPPRLDVFDVHGRRVAVLIDPMRRAGGPGLTRGSASGAGASYGMTIGRVRWDGMDAGGRTVPPGVYFARLSSGTRQSSVRLVRLR